MSSLNQCQFIGNLGQDPEVKSFSNGNRVCNLRLAVSERWKDKSGERQEKTEWISVAIFSEGLIGVAEKYLRKGSKLFVSGKLSTRKWQDQAGSDRYSTEIILQGPSAVLTMLDSAQGGQAGQQRQSASAGSDNGGWHGQAPRGGFADDLDDGLPDWDR